MGGFILTGPNYIFKERFDLTKEYSTYQANISRESEQILLEHKGKIDYESLYSIHMKTFGELAMKTAIPYFGKKTNGFYEYTTEKRGILPLTLKAKVFSQSVGNGFICMVLILVITVSVVKMIF